MNYCIAVWGVSSKNATKPLQISQKKLVRAIYGADRTDNAGPLYNSLKSCNAKDEYNYMVCKYIYKIISRNENIFVHHESQHNTRQALNQVLHFPYTYSTQTKQSFANSGTKVLNYIPGKHEKMRKFCYLQIQPESSYLVQPC